MYTNSLLSAKAQSIIQKVKAFDSPDLIFTLNDSIRKEASSRFELDQKKIRSGEICHKTFHHEAKLAESSRSSHKILNNNSFTNSNGFYAVNKEREKARELAEWVNIKIE